MTRLADLATFGTSLPHRSLEPIDPDDVRLVSERAEQLGFADLWVTENTFDSAYCFDPIATLSYAAALTTRIRLGVSAIVVTVQHPAHVAHQLATLDQLSRGRAIAVLGLGRDEHFAAFQVPAERRVRRFVESIGVIRQLWAPGGTGADHAGDIYDLRGRPMALRPVQSPFPLWMGGDHPQALQRAATLGDGWMGPGSQPTTDFFTAVHELRRALEAANRDPAGFPISKRVFISVDDRAERARRRLERWFGGAYGSTELTDTAGIAGTPEVVAERLEDLLSAGPSHLLLNPVADIPDQVGRLADIVGLPLHDPAPRLVTA